MRIAMIITAAALATPAVAGAARPKVTWWVAQSPAKPPRPPKPPTPPALSEAPEPPKPGRVVVIKSGPRGHAWTVPTRKRAFLGVQLLQLTDELRRHFGVAEGEGVMISQVEKDTPAAAAGVVVGDVLVAIDGNKIGSGRDVVRAIRTRNDGDTVSLSVIRKGKTKTLEATLAVRETPQIDLSGLFHLDPNELRLEVDGEQIELPLPPMPQVDELRDHVREMLENNEVLRHFEREKDLEKRLRELEDKLRDLEKKMQGKAREAAAATRDA